jgi:hypothetical protein
MGVKSCFRKDCDSIMCDTYVQNVGYVCPDCQTEFKSKHRDLRSEGEIMRELTAFMDTRKEIAGDKDMDVDDFFKSYTKE